MAPNTTTLPTQTQFLENGLTPCTENYPCPKDISCTICTSSCNESEGVVQLFPCAHYFHRECIVLWFKSGSTGRGRCPNCRVDLFKPDPPQESDQLITQRREWGEALLVRAHTVHHRYRTKNDPSQILRSWYLTTEDREFLNEECQFIMHYANNELQDAENQELADRFYRFANAIQNTLLQAETMYSDATKNAKALRSYIKDQFASARNDFDKHLGVDTSFFWIAQMMAGTHEDIELYRNSEDGQELRRIMHSVHMLERVIAENIELQERLLASPELRPATVANEPVVASTVDAEFENLLDLATAGLLE
ncbi:hypothetical protein P154DRAFT_598243 [Amniculicola lignicola CBS 123094]|uniref:RING-type domain-containing protein n=1 Tax=Amniculicola lignicola CBS 123094 TaxID=1392246 RepID=A0A6A5WKI8_9PLEO|nr:hypothetical protein P154DRAFT_598243 [Amniculicola lignicola CBS 123094]